MKCDMICEYGPICDAKARHKADENVFLRSWGGRGGLKGSKLIENPMQAPLVCLES